MTHLVANKLKPWIWSRSFSRQKFLSTSLNWSLTNPKPWSWMCSNCKSKMWKRYKSNSGERL